MIAFYWRHRRTLHCLGEAAASSDAGRTDSRERFHSRPTQAWTLFRKTLKHTFPAPSYVPLELKHVLKCRLEQQCFPEQTQERNGLLLHHPAPFCLPEQCLCQHRAGMRSSPEHRAIPAPEHRCAAKMPQKNAFPTVLLNDCAVYSGLNGLKEKSCWERLLILY